MIGCTEIPNSPQPVQSWRATRMEETQVTTSRLIPSGQVKFSYSNIKENCCLFTYSNRYGMAFVCTTNGVLLSIFGQLEKEMSNYLVRQEIAVQSGHAMDDVTNKIPVYRKIGLSGDPHYLALSKDENFLAVAHFNKVEVYRLLDWEKHQTIRPIATTTVGISTVLSLAWGGTSVPLLAVLSSSNELRLFDTQLNDKGQHSEANSLITSFSWNPEGDETIACGTDEGNVILLDANNDFNEIRQLKDPFHGTKRVSYVCWVEPVLFFVGYDDDTSDATAVLFHGDDVIPLGVVVYYYPEDDIKHCYFVEYIPEWNTFFVGCNLSPDIELVVWDEGEEKWSIWKFDEKFQPRLPMDEEEEDTVPVGFALCLNSTREIPSDNEEDPNYYPAPLLLCTTSGGILSTFSFLDLTVYDPLDFIQPYKELFPYHEETLQEEIDDSIQEVEEEEEEETLQEVEEEEETLQEEIDDSFQEGEEEDDSFQEEEDDDDSFQEGEEEEEEASEEEIDEKEIGEKDFGKVDKDEPSLIFEDDYGKTDSNTFAEDLDELYDSEREREEEEANAQKAFRSVDIVKSGYIDRKMLEKVLAHLKISFTKVLCDKIMKKLGDGGKIREPDFVRWYVDWVLGDVESESSSDEEQEQVQDDGDTSIERITTNTKDSSQVFAKFAVKEGSWRCEGCRVVNEKEASQCKACEQRNPNFQGGQQHFGNTIPASAPGAVTANGFSFGIPSSTSSKDVSPPATTTTSSSSFSATTATFTPSNMPVGFSFMPSNPDQKLPPSLPSSVVSITFGENVNKESQRGQDDAKKNQEIFKTLSSTTSSKPSDFGTNDTNSFASEGDSDDEDDEEVRQEERENALNAFEKVDAGGLGSVEADQFETLITQLGSTYCPEVLDKHKTKLVVNGKIEKDSFVDWYVDWIMGDEEEEEADLSKEMENQDDSSASSKNKNVFAKFAPKEGYWKCEQCSIQNAPNASQCIACEAKSPNSVVGGQGKAEAKVTSDAPGAIGSNGFSFGGIASSNVASSSVTPQGFSFKNAQQESSSGGVPTQGFSFKNAQQGSSGTSTSGGFNFFSMNNKADPPKNLFGATTTTTTPSAGVFSTSTGFSEFRSSSNPSGDAMKAMKQAAATTSSFGGGGAAAAGYPPNMKNQKAPDLPDAMKPKAAAGGYPPNMKNQKAPDLPDAMKPKPAKPAVFGGGAAPAGYPPNMKNQKSPDLPDAMKPKPAKPAVFGGGAAPAGYPPNMKNQKAPDLPDAMKPKPAVFGGGAAPVGYPPNMKNQKSPDLPDAMKPKAAAGGYPPNMKNQKAPDLPDAMKPKPAVFGGGAAPAGYPPNMKNQKAPDLPDAMKPKPAVFGGGAAPVGYPPNMRNQKAPDLPDAMKPKPAAAAGYPPNMKNQKAPDLPDAMKPMKSAPTSAFSSNSFGSFTTKDKSSMGFGSTTSTSFSNSMFASSMSLKSGGGSTTTSTSNMFGRDSTKSDGVVASSTTKPGSLFAPSQKTSESQSRITISKAPPSATSKPSIPSKLSDSSSSKFSSSSSQQQQQQPRKNRYQMGHPSGELERQVWEIIVSFDKKLMDIRNSASNLGKSDATVVHYEEKCSELTKSIESLSLMHQEIASLRKETEQDQLNTLATSTDVHKQLEHAQILSASCQDKVFRSLIEDEPLDQRSEMMKTQLEIKLKDIERHMDDIERQLVFFMNPQNEQPLRATRAEGSSRLIKTIRQTYESAKLQYDLVCSLSDRMNNLLRKNAKANKKREVLFVRKPNDDDDNETLISEIIHFQENNQKLQQDFLSLCQNQVTIVKVAEKAIKKKTVSASDTSDASDTTSAHQVPPSKLLSTRRKEIPSQLMASPRMATPETTTTNEVKLSFKTTPVKAGARLFQESTTSTTSTSSSSSSSSFTSSNLHTRPPIAPTATSTLLSTKASGNEVKPGFSFNSKPTLASDASDASSSSTTTTTTTTSGEENKKKFSFVANEPPLSQTINSSSTNSSSTPNLTSLNVPSNKSSKTDNVDGNLSFGLSSVSFTKPNSENKTKVDTKGESTTKRIFSEGSSTTTASTTPFTLGSKTESSKESSVSSSNNNTTSTLFGKTTTTGNSNSSPSPFGKLSTESSNTTSTTAATSTATSSFSSLGSTSSFGGIDYTKKLTEFYMKHNPEKVKCVQETLEKYKGKETELFQKLEKRYITNKSTTANTTTTTTTTSSSSLFGSQKQPVSVFGSTLGGGGGAGGGIPSASPFGGGGGGSTTTIPSSPASVFGDASTPSTPSFGSSLGGGGGGLSTPSRFGGETPTFGSTTLKTSSSSGFGVTSSSGSTGGFGGGSFGGGNSSMNNNLNSSNSGANTGGFGQVSTLGGGGGGGGGGFGSSATPATPSSPSPFGVFGGGVNSSSSNNTFGAVDYKTKLIEFYKVHNPAKLSEVDATLTKFKGQENILFEKLEKKYNVKTSKGVFGTPTPAFGASSAMGGGFGSSTTSFGTTSGFGTQSKLGFGGFGAQNSSQPSTTTTGSSGGFGMAAAAASGGGSRGFSSFSSGGTTSFASVAGNANRNTSFGSENSSFGGANTTGFGGAGTTGFGGTNSTTGFGGAGTTGFGGTNSTTGFGGTNSATGFGGTNSATGFGSPSPQFQTSSFTQMR